MPNYHSFIYLSLQRKHTSGDDTLFYYLHSRFHKGTINKQIRLRHTHESWININKEYIVKQKGMVMCWLVINNTVVEITHQILKTGCVINLVHYVIALCFARISTFPEASMHTTGHI